jgi:hypothetical protein
MKNIAPERRKIEVDTPLRSLKAVIFAQLLLPRLIKINFRYAGVERLPTTE